MFELPDPIDTTMSHAVAEGVANLALTEADQPLVLLCQRLALLIDEAEDQERAYYRHAPRLLAVLRELGATPASRPKQAPAAPAAGALAALRQAN